MTTTLSLLHKVFIAGHARRRPEVHEVRTETHGNVTIHYYS